MFMVWSGCCPEGCEVDSQNGEAPLFSSYKELLEECFPVPSVSVLSMYRISEHIGFGFHQCVGTVLRTCGGLVVKRWQYGSEASQAVPAGFLNKTPIKVST